MIVPTGSLHLQLQATPYYPKTLSMDVLAPATTAGLTAAAGYWIDKSLKDKFNDYAAAKYGFLPRSPRYQRDKATRETMKDRYLQVQRPVVKPPTALVLFGDLKRELVSRSFQGFAPEIVATARKTEVAIKVRSPHPMRGRQWLELRHTLPFQERAMTRLVQDEFTKGLTAVMAA